ncbi:MAG: hypothetical protein KF841_07275 [Phycisphaerae bacterium]|nr:hypothetical protein [Phycisphaerae bacterium]
MIDPNHVILQCPNGHELQAARTDLDKKLECPVCNVTFLPVIEDTSRSGVPAPQPLPLLPRPDRPAYTNWMLGFWIWVPSWLTFFALLSVLFPSLGASGGVSKLPPSVSMLLGSVSCLWLVCIAVVIVMQLMWIFRVHVDAERFGYRVVSPGLALGLSLIPVVNIIWTAYALLRLARFSAEDSGSLRGVKSGASINWARVNLIASLLVLATFLTATYLLNATIEQARLEALQQGVQDNTPEMTAKVKELAGFTPVVFLAPLLISCAGTVVYAFAVRRVEDALYERLRDRDRSPPPQT